MNDEITLIIKTFNRPRCLHALLESINLYYGAGIPIIIVDDGYANYPCPANRNIKYIKTEFDIGISRGRNIGLSHAQTPYIVTLDDDFVFIPETKLEIWLDILKNSNIDLIGGNVENIRYEACFEIENRVLKYMHKDKGGEYGCKLYDLVLQFWMGKTEKIKGFGGWCDEFLAQDHSAFFLQAFNKIKIGHTNSVKIDHKPIRTPEYNNFRFRGGGDQLLLKKFNLDRIIDYHGRVIERE